MFQPTEPSGYPGAERQLVDFILVAEGAACWPMWESNGQRRCPELTLQPREPPVCPCLGIPVLDSSLPKLGVMPLSGSGSPFSSWRCNEMKVGGQITVKDSPGPLVLIQSNAEQHSDFPHTTYIPGKDGIPCGPGSPGS